MDAVVEMDNYDCNLIIHTWDKGEAEYRLTIDAQTRSDEDGILLENYLQGLEFSASRSSVSFRNRFWTSRNSIGNRTIMKLKNGDNITLSSIELRAELWIPSRCDLKLASKYSEIKMEDFAGPFSLDLYNDNFYGANVTADIKLIDKYSTIEFNDTKDIKADLYNSRLDIDNAGDLVIESKYSKINIGSAGRIEINSYNDKYGITSTGDMSFTAKYSDLNTESSGNVELDCYEGTIIINNVRNITLTSKYTDYRFDVAEECSAVSLYNNKLTAGRMISLDIKESKYSVFRIDELSASLSESSGYNDNFIIENIGSNFEGIFMNGKYIDLSVDLPITFSYRFKAKVKYADFDIDESSMKPIVKVITGSDIEYNAVKGTEKEEMPVIEVNGYQMSVKITDR